MTNALTGLLGPGEIRRLAEDLDLRPTKTLGQNFVHDGNTVRRIIDVSGVGPDDHVLEIGPGLGSLTLGLAQVAGSVTAVEIDPRLADQLPRTMAERVPHGADRLTVLHADALTVTAADLPNPPTAVVANLPYNVSVPVLLHLLAELPSIASILVMVQAEVADRLVAGPGSRTYGGPSVKLAWYGSARRAGAVGRSVFWPVPKVESALVAVDCTRPFVGSDVPAPAVFAAVDAAFAQRRKTLRAALSAWVGSSAAAEQICREAGVDPQARGETLSVDDYVALARVHASAV